MKATELGGSSKIRREASAHLPVLATLNERDDDGSGGLRFCCVGGREDFHGGAPECGAGVQI